MSPSNTTVDNERTADGVRAPEESDAATMTIDWSPDELERDELERDAAADEIDGRPEAATAAPAAAGSWLARTARGATGSFRRSPRKPILIAAAAVVALVAAVAGTMTAMAKTVTISVDGVSQSVTTLSGTVDGALSSAGITIGAHDSLAPAGRSTISDGSQIAVNRGRTFTATIDGTEHTAWTTATTVAGALADLGEQAADFELSVPAAAAVPLSGLSITAATLHTVSLSVTPALATTQAAVRSVASASTSAKIASDSPRSFAATESAGVPAAVDHTTAARTVGDFLQQQGVTVAANQRVTPSLDTALTDGTAISVVTLPTVSLTIGTRDTVTVYSDTTTVGGLLADKGIALSSYDEVSPGVDAPLVDGMDVTITKVSYETTTTSETVAQPADKQVSDASLTAGTKKVVSEGHPGEITVYYHTKIANGVAGEPVEVSRKTVTAAVASVVHIGTKSTAPSSGSTEPAAIGANGVNWDAVAQCESGQRWNINTGNGYYGGLQFDIRTWLGNGGGKYAPRADLATKAQQIEIANFVYAHRGLQPWGCGWAG